MIRTTPAILSSVWGDMVRSVSCRFDPDTGAISDVQTTEFHSPDDIPQSQFVTVDGHQYAVERNELVTTGESWHCFLDNETRTPVSLKKRAPKVFEEMDRIIKETL